MSDIIREEVKARLDANEARAATAVEGMRADLKAGLSDFRVELEKMRGEFHQALSAQTKWIVVILFGTLASAGTAWGFLKPSASAAPFVQPTPYVIYAQPSLQTQAPLTTLPISKP